MPRLANAFTDIQLRHLKKEGVTALGGVQGLCVRVENGRKTFIFRYTFQKKKREVTIGSYPVISLSEAREKEMAYRKLLSEEIDPKEWRDRQREEKIENERKKELAELKFSTVADRYLAQRDTFSPFPIKERDLFLGRLGNYILPQIGSKTLETITPSDVADILLPLWNEHQALCKKLRQIVRQIFSWAKAKGLTTVANPVDPQVLQHLLPQIIKKEKRHHAMLAVEDIPNFMKDLRQHPSISARCLEFAILTAVRSGNAREAEWSEINWDKKAWIIPAKKMKVPSNGDHVVPLSTQVLELLKSIEGLNESKYIFLSPATSSKLSDASLKSVIKKMHIESLLNGGKGYFDPKQVNKSGNRCIATPHGLARASFRTWAQDDELGNDRKFSERTAELCLHHKASDSYKGAYERNEAMKSRIEMMQAWSDYCFSERENERFL